MQKGVVHGSSLLTSSVGLFWVFSSIKETHFSFNLEVLQVLGTNDIKRNKPILLGCSLVPSLDRLPLVNFLGRLMAEIPLFLDSLI